MVRDTIRSMELTSNRDFVSDEVAGDSRMSRASETTRVAF
jgi:hypothetical protein